MWISRYEQGRRAGRWIRLGRPDGSVDIDLIFPLKLQPHASKLGLSAVGGVDIVHDVNVDIVENDAVHVKGRRAIIYDITKNDTRFSRRDLRVKGKRP